MKQRLKTISAAIFLSMISVGAFSQEQPSKPAWVSEKGYWVVESNIKSPLNHIVWFYNNDHFLVYKETLTGIKLNTNKRKVKMKLKKALEASVIAWENSKQSAEETAVLKNILE